jgi:hypothetical protein
MKRWQPSGSGMKQALYFRVTSPIRWVVVKELFELFLLFRVGSPLFLVALGHRVSAHHSLSPLFSIDLFDLLPMNLFILAGPLP